MIGAQRVSSSLPAALGVVVTALTLGTIGPIAAEPASDVTAAHEIIAKMIDREPALQSYRSRVHVDVHMLSFPFLSPTLDGTSYYRHPGSYEVVFDRVPFYAKAFSRLFDDVGDAAAWEKDHDVSLDGTQVVDGRSLVVLRLTKKIHSTILDHALAFIDPATYQLEQMEWDYTSGGKIVMIQTYRSENGYSVLASQHATIAIPHVRAVADAHYGPYETEDAAH
jgi:hypothetical protein